MSNTPYQKEPDAHRMGSCENQMQLLLLLGGTKQTVMTAPAAAVAAAPRRFYLMGSQSAILAHRQQLHTAHNTTESHLDECLRRHTHTHSDTS